MYIDFINQPYIVDEDDGTAVLTLELEADEPIQSDIWVTYATIDSSALG